MPLSLRHHTFVDAEELASGERKASYEPPKLPNARGQNAPGLVSRCLNIGHPTVRREAFTPDCKDRIKPDFSSRELKIFIRG